MISTRFQRVRFLVSVTLLYLVLLFCHFRGKSPRQEVAPLRAQQYGDISVFNRSVVFKPGVAKPASEPYTKTVVMGRLKSDDISWVYSELPEFNKSIYTVDDDNSEPRVPKNKGREAMVYLTYIIDNYDNLPDTVLFFHPDRIAWHNNVLLDLDTAKTIQRLSDARVAREGYFNSRCDHDPGCPDWLHIDRPKAELDPIKKMEERWFTSKVWRELHPYAQIPSALSQPCCAQFAVSGERIRARPRSHYEHYRKWLLEADIEDKISGRIMEYSWQYIFTGKAELCPPQHQCYCDGYGICFGGTTNKNLENWLGLLRKQEQVDFDLFGLKVEHPDRVGEILAKQALTDELGKTLNDLKRQAYERGEDPRNRALECGRT